MAAKGQPFCFRKGMTGLTCHLPHSLYICDKAMGYETVASFRDSDRFRDC